MVVDDVATFVDLEHRLGFAVDDHVHGLREWRRKVNLDAQVTLLHQVEAAAVRVHVYSIDNPDTVCNSPLQVQGRRAQSVGEDFPLRIEVGERSTFLHVCHHRRIMYTKAPVDPATAAVIC